MVLVAIAALTGPTATAALAAPRRTGIAREVAAAVEIAATAATVEVPIGIGVAVEVLILMLILVLTAVGI